MDLEGEICRFPSRVVQFVHVHIFAMWMVCETCSFSSQILFQGCGQAGRFEARSCAVLQYWEAGQL